MPLPASDVAHLLRRVGFGGLPAEIRALTSLTWPQAVEAVLDTSGAPPLDQNPPNLDPNRGSWDRYVDMVWYWLERCRTSPAPIVEKMVLFWHGYLCTSLDKVGNHRMLFEQNQLFRVHGMGDIETLLQLVAVQPAMLEYLDNDVNVAGSPNENFARELMELFTLGVGHYTEDDVRASARAWTGHGVDRDSGQYVFRPEEHDNGSKTFMGVTRNWNGPEIISHLIDGPTRSQASRFIATKLWSFLAYPDPEPAVVDSIGSSFRSAGMDITALIRAILLHPQFRSDKAKTGLVRSPVEYVVAAMRHTGLPCSVAHPEWTLEAMGQQPFYPPNVSGWRPNGYWITASALWAKSQFASRMRWRGIEADNLLGSEGRSVSEAVHAALVMHGIDRPSPSTVSALENFVEEERASSRWAERAGLLFLPLLTPEFQLA